jgi:hypothetical protein
MEGLGQLGQLLRYQTGLSSVGLPLGAYRLDNSIHFLFRMLRCFPLRGDGGGWAGSSLYLPLAASGPSCLKRGSCYCM